MLRESQRRTNGTDSEHRRTKASAEILDHVLATSVGDGTATLVDMTDIVGDTSVLRPESPAGIRVHETERAAAPFLLCDTAPPNSWPAVPASSRPPSPPSTRRRPETQHEPTPLGTKDAHQLGVETPASAATESEAEKKCPTRDRRTTAYLLDGNP